MVVCWGESRGGLAGQGASHCCDGACEREERRKRKGADLKYCPEEQLTGLGSACVWKHTEGESKVSARVLKGVFT